MTGPAPPDPTGSLPFRSSSTSFPYFVGGGIAYFVGVVLVLGGVVDAPWDLIEIGLLVVGSVLVLAGFVVDASARSRAARPRVRPAKGR